MLPNPATIFPTDYTVALPEEGVSLIYSSAESGGGRQSR